MHAAHRNHGKQDRTGVHTGICSVCVVNECACMYTLLLASNNVYIFGVEGSWLSPVALHAFVCACAFGTCVCFVETVCVCTCVHVCVCMRERGERVHTFIT